MALLAMVCSLLECLVGKVRGRPVPAGMPCRRCSVGAIKHCCRCLLHESPARLKAARPGAHTPALAARWHAELTAAPLPPINRLLP